MLINLVSIPRVNLISIPWWKIYLHMLLPIEFSNFSSFEKTSESRDFIKRKALTSHFPISSEICIFNILVTWKTESFSREARKVPSKITLPRYRKKLHQAKLRSQGELHLRKIPPVKLSRSKPNSPFPRRITSFYFKTRITAAYFYVDIRLGFVPSPTQHWNK